MKFWQVIVTICQHIIIMLHTIPLSTRNFVTARPRNNICALLLYLTRESGGNRAYVLQEKAKAIDLPFCTKEIGKKIISKLF